LELNTQMQLSFLREKNNKKYCSCVFGSNNCCLRLRVTDNCSLSLQK
jgi:hypothetical protein